ncbi:MAG: hypothetical protein AAGA56_08520, partial [Myxococcota bacterium]
MKRTNQLIPVTALCLFPLLSVIACGDDEQAVDGAATVSAPDDETTGDDTTPSDEEATTTTPGDGGGAPVVPADITQADLPDFGTVVTDGEGRSLYLFTRDVPGDDSNAPVSNCTGSCLDNWPVYDGGEAPVVEGLNAAAVERFERADGTMQTTWRGWPLYYFANDDAAGDLNGD